MKNHPELTYPSTLLMSTEKKTCEALGKIAETSGDTMLRLLEDPGTTKEWLIQNAQHTLNPKKKWILAIDDTLIAKAHSNFIAGTSDNFDSSTRQIYRSLCTVVVMVTDGKSSVPIDHSLWINKEFAEEQYKTKTELAIALIPTIVKNLNIYCVAMDGLYATKKMTGFFNNNKINFEMRIRSNSRIELQDKTSVILKEYFATIMKGKRKDSSTIKGFWNGEPAYFTAERYDEDTVVFLISNFQAAPQEHIKIYRMRWHIEKFFRTAKQRLGLKDCQSRKLVAQYNHILYVCVAYSLLQLERKSKKYKTPEEAHRRLRKKTYCDLIKHFSAPRQIFGVVYA